MSPFFFRIALFLLALGLLSPASAYAQLCEVGVAQGAAEALDQGQNAAVEAVTEALKGVYEAGIEVPKNLLIDPGKLQKMDQDIIKKLDWMWEQWRDSLKLMTKQLSANTLEQSRQMASNYDATGIMEGGVRQLYAEYQSIMAYKPTNQVCQFDSNAKHFSRGRSVSRGVMRGYSLDFSDIGNAKKGSPGAGGKATLQKARWESYQSKFCDPEANNGASGCDTSTDKVNMHILPSKTFFARETVDLEDPDTQEAVSQLMFNITGYDVPDLIPESSLSSPGGLEQRQEHREYIAQMDAVSALVYGVVADRAPGAEAPEIKAMRQKSGVPDALISDKPSHREIRQAIVEQLWDPNYFKELLDSPNTIPQKELYLKAYSLVMLFDMIARQERISTVYAIETANMLDKHDSSRGGATSSAPVRK